MAFLTLTLGSSLLPFLVRSGRNRNLKKWIADCRLSGCNVHEVVYNPMFSEMTFLLTESLELVEGKEANYPELSSSIDPAFE